MTYNTDKVTTNDLKLNSRYNNTTNLYECSGNKVIFTTTSKKLSIQLPDRSQLDLEKADFSNTLFSVVCTICRDLRVRHPEELSLLRLASLVIYI